MAITTLGAIALGVGAIGSAAISSGASKKAANAATDAANQSAAVQREQLQAAQNALAPYNRVGLPATGQINALLGLGGDDPASVDYGRFVDSNPNALAAFNTQSSGGYSGHPWFSGIETPFGVVNGAPGGVMDKATFGKQWAAQNNADLSAYTTPGQTAADKARAGFDLFRNSTGYDFRLKQGMNALNAGYAGAGTIKSGAAIKGAIDYGQGMASQEFGNYLNALGNQQAVGQASASALAGVGQNYANSLGNIYANKADAIGNAAMLNARNMNTMIGGLSGGIMKYGMR